MYKINARARAFWLLKIYGHKNIRLLDGHKQKWLDENRPTTSEVPKIAPTMYKAQEPDWSLRINREDILKSIGKKDTVPVDTRTVEMYNGLNNAGCKRAGRARATSGISWLCRRCLLSDNGTNIPERGSLYSTLREILETTQRW